MSLHQRRAAVAAAEARAAACIAKARGKVAASRDGGESLAFPAGVVTGGLLAGVALERAQRRGSRPRQEPSRDSQTRMAPDATSGWLSLAHLGMAMRLWREFGPLLDGRASAADDQRAPVPGTAAADRPAPDPARCRE